MMFKFEKTGAERKALVAAISEITGVKSEYLGAPGFAYRVGGCVISKDGAVDTGAMGTGGAIALAAALREQGFVPIWEPAEADRAPDVMRLDLPAGGAGDAAFDNLRKLAAGKASLIRMAIGDDLAGGAVALPIVHEDGRVCFPWFRPGMGTDAVAAWSRFVAALWNAAKRQGRVTLKERPLDEGESVKFAMRCFLLKLGFIGDEYKQARKVILAGLPGNGSHKKPKPGEVLENG